MSIKKIHDDIMNRELQELCREEGRAEGELKERKRNLTLLIRKVLSSNDVAWLDQCSSEQLSYGLNIIMECKSFEEFKDKVLNYK